MEKFSRSNVEKLIFLSLFTGAAVFASLYVHVSNAPYLSQLPSFLFIKIELSKYSVLSIFWPFPSIICAIAFLISYMHFKLFEALAYAGISFLVGVGGYDIYWVTTYWSVIQALQGTDFPLVETFVIIGAVWLAFLLAGSIGGFYTKSMTVPSVGNVESMVLEYIRSHEGKMQISKCAEELGIPRTQVEEILSRLQQKGLVKTKT